MKLNRFFLVAVLVVFVGGCIPVEEGERVEAMGERIEQLKAERNELASERDELQEELDEVKAGAIQEAEADNRVDRRARRSAAVAQVCDHLPVSPPICDVRLVAEGRKALAVGFTPSPWVLTGIFAAIMAAFVFIPLATTVLILVAGWRAWLVMVLPKAEEVEQAQKKVDAVDREITDRRHHLADLEREIQRAEDQRQSAAAQASELQAEVERMENEASNLKKALAAMRGS